MSALSSPAFADILATLRGGEGRFEVDFGDGWLQGRSVFGGLVMAAATRAMGAYLATDLPLRQVSVTFVDAVYAGAATLVCTLLRRGKSVTLARCEVVQEGRLAVTAVFAYGVARQLPYQRLPRSQTPARALDDLRDIRHVAGKTPSFAHHFGFRWAEGAKPLSGGEPNHRVFVRHHGATGDLGVEHLIALADCTSSPLSAAATDPLLYSSLSWTLDLLPHELQFPADAWCRLDTDVIACQDGYSSEATTLVGPDNRVLAIGHQCLVVYPGK